MRTRTDQLRDLDISMEGLRELPDRNAVTWYCDARSGRIERDLWHGKFGRYAPSTVGIQLSFDQSMTIVTVKRDGYVLPPGYKSRVRAPHFDWHALTVDRYGQSVSADRAVHDVIVRELPEMLGSAEDSHVYHLRYEGPPAEPSSPHRITTGAVFDGGHNGLELTSIYRATLERLADLALQIAAKK